MKSERGQATVEVALTLPLVALLLGVIVETGIVAAGRSRAWNAAREAARVAAVHSEEDVVERAVDEAGLAGAEVIIEPAPMERVQGEPVTVRLTYGHEGVLPLVGNIFGAVTFEASATMRIERP